MLAEVWQKGLHRIASVFVEIAVPAKKSVWESTAPSSSITRF
jgi:hypothetical protein